MEAFLDRWAQALWSLMTPRRAQRCAIVGTITAVIAFVVGWLYLPPQPIWTWHFTKQEQWQSQVLVGFSPGSRWLVQQGYRADPEDLVLRIWDLRDGGSAPRHISVLPRLRGNSRNFVEYAFSHDDRTLIYFFDDGGTYTAHFVDLETGTEVKPWTFAEPNWQQPLPKHRLVERPSRPLQPPKLEFSPRGRWLMLRCQHRVAVADRNTRTFVLALGNVAQAIFDPDDRHLYVQEYAVKPVSVSFVITPAGWSDYDLITGQSVPLHTDRIPKPSIPPIPGPVRSADGRFLAEIDRDGQQLSRGLRLFSDPLGPPWGLIALVAFGSVLAVIAVMELFISWWQYGSDVNDTPDGEEGGVDAD